MENSKIQLEHIQNTILVIRGQKVMIDRDLAKLYGVQTKRLNQQVNRNINRFPNDFMFQLNDKEKEWVVANCNHLEVLKFSKTNPYAFTEHGAVMLASILNTDVAINAGIQVVRAFVQIRTLLLSNKHLSKELKRLEQKYDSQFNLVFQTLSVIIDEPKPKKRKIGFLRENDE